MSEQRQPQQIQQTMRTEIAPESRNNNFGFRLARGSAP